MKQKLIDGDEYDALTKGGRKVLNFRPGQRARIKRKARRRLRHEFKNKKALSELAE